MEDTILRFAFDANVDEVYAKIRETADVRLNEIANDYENGVFGDTKFNEDVINELIGRQDNE
jgi:hypothetical protein